jgi:hypothetical protein
VHRAKDNVRTLVSCLEDVFNIQLTLVKLEETDKLPISILVMTINSTIGGMKAYSNPLPSLFILAYIGHGMLDTATGLLKVVAGPGRQNILMFSSPPTNTKRPMSIPSAS